MIPDEKNIDSLLSLLSDPDKTVYKGVERGLLALGTIAVPHLLELEKETKNKLLKKRCQEIVRQIRYNRCIAEMKLWLLFDDPFNWDFIYIFSEFNNPQFDRKKIEAELNVLEADFYNRYPNLETPEDAAEALKKFIFNDCGFRFDFDALLFDNLLIDKFFENRRGASFLFTLLYARLGKSRHLDILPVTFPGNIVLVFSERDLSIGAWKLLFYINPANGETFSRKGIELFLEKNNLKPEPGYFSPSSTSRVAFLYLRQMVSAYKQKGDKVMAQQLKEIIDTVLTFENENSK